MSNNNTPFAFGDPLSLSEKVKENADAINDIMDFNVNTNLIPLFDFLNEMENGNANSKQKDVNIQTNNRLTTLENEGVIVTSDNVQNLSNQVGLNLTEALNSNKVIVDNHTTLIGNLDIKVDENADDIRVIQEDITQLNTDLGATNLQVGTNITNISTNTGNIDLLAASISGGVGSAIIHQHAILDQLLTNTEHHIHPSIIDIPSTNESLLSLRTETIGGQLSDVFSIKSDGTFIYSASGVMEQDVGNNVNCVLELRRFSDDGIETETSFTVEFSGSETTKHVTVTAGETFTGGNQELYPTFRILSIGDTMIAQSLFQFSATLQASGSGGVIFSRQVFNDSDSSPAGGINPALIQVNTNTQSIIDLNTNKGDISKVSWIVKPYIEGTPETDLDGGRIKIIYDGTVLISDGIWIQAMDGPNAVNYQEFYGRDGVYGGLIYVTKLDRTKDIRLDDQPIGVLPSLITYYAVEKRSQ